jgi:hypothetical protein
MKTLILAAFAALSLGVGAANAQSVPSSAAPQTGIHQSAPLTSGFDADWANG